MADWSQTHRDRRAFTLQKRLVNELKVAPIDADQLSRVADLLRLPDSLVRSLVVEAGTMFPPLPTTTRLLHHASRSLTASLIEAGLLPTSADADLIGALYDPQSQLMRESAGHAAVAVSTFWRSGALADEAWDVLAGAVRSLPHVGRQRRVPIAGWVQEFGRLLAVPAVQAVDDKVDREEARRAIAEADEAFSGVPSP